MSGKTWRTIFCVGVYLQDGSVEEESQQLDQIIVDITIFLLHTNDVWRVIRFILIYLVLVEREEAKLEEVLDDDSDLELEQIDFFNSCEDSVTVKRVPVTIPLYR